MRFCGLTIGPASLLQPRGVPGHAGGVVVLFCDAARSVPLSRFRSAQSVPFSSARSVLRGTGRCLVPCYRSEDLLLPPTSTRFRHFISPHSLFIALARSLALRAFFRRPALCRFCCSFSLFWPALSLPVCGLHGAGVLPFSSCRPVSAARFRPGSTGGREGRVVGKIGKLSVLSKLLSVFLLGTGAHPPGGADVRRVRDHLSARAKGPCRGRVVAVMTSVIWGRCFSGRSPIHRCIEPLRCR